MRESLFYRHNIREQICEIDEFMYVVAIGWMYVVGMASVAEAMSPNGSVLGALMTFIGWGLVPLSIVLYILGTPARKRQLRQQQVQEQAQERSPERNKAASNETDSE